MDNHVDTLLPGRSNDIHDGKNPPITDMFGSMHS